MTTSKSLLRSAAASTTRGAGEGTHRTLPEGVDTRAVAEERERIAGDLHDTVGQLFVSIGLLARRYEEHLPPDSPWASRVRRLADLADRGKWEIDRAIHALAFVPEGRRGLIQSLRSLARSFESDSGIAVLFDVEGQAERLPTEEERALYRVAHEALTNAWRHARCASVRIVLAFESPAVSLRVLDDGVGLGPRHERQETRVGIRVMRRALADVGGSLRVRSAKPHGVVVEAHIAQVAR